MKCQKMKKFSYIGLSAFMVLYFSLCSFIGSYASTTESGDSLVPIQQQWADNVYNNFQTLLQDSLKVSVPKTEADRIWNDYVDHAYSIWNLEYDDLHQHYGHFRDYVGAQFEMEKNPDNTYNYNMSEDAYTFIQDSFNTYVQSNPLGYTQCTIPSYNMLNADYFYTYQSYTAVKEFIRQSGSYCYLAHNGTNNSSRKFFIITIPNNINYGLYGTVTQGAFTNVNAIYNWQASTQPFNLGLGLKFYTCNPDGTISETTVAQGNVRSITNLSNVPSANSTSLNWVIMSPLARNETVYVFSSVDAYKRWNTGSPQPYYMMSDYSGIIDPTGYQVPNTNNSYESIVNNIQTGWTAQEVLELVDRIMSNGSGSGNGSGNGGSDSSGLWSRIGDAIGNLIDGIINVLTTVIEHLSDALLSVIHLLTGYTDENGVVHEGLFGKLLNLVNSGFNNFLASIFSWLPEEIVTLFTAVLVFGIFFGLLKMLRR